MTRQQINISIKMVLAGVIALIVTYLLNFEYYTTAAAVSILSIQLTKRDFIVIAVKRVISGITAILLSALMFYLLGQTFLVFALFLIIFIVGSWFFNIQDGIVASVVLVTHLLIVDTITFGFVIEEILLLIIAIGIAFLINMFYPEITKASIKKSLLNVDDIIEKQVVKIERILTNKDFNYTRNYQEELNKIMVNAKMIDQNIIVQNDHRYITYLSMRNNQLHTLFKVEENLRNLKINHTYQLKIADFFNKISKNIGFDNNASFLLKDLETLNNFFINEPLPKSRDEFEIRAILFQTLVEIEHFLNLKDDFHEQYPNFITVKD